MGQGKQLREAMGSGGVGLLGTRWPLPLLLLLIVGEWGPPSSSPHSWTPGWIYGLDPRPAEQEDLLSLALGVTTTVVVGCGHGHGCVHRDSCVDPGLRTLTLSLPLAIWK